MCIYPTKQFAKFSYQQQSDEKSSAHKRDVLQLADHVFFFEQENFVEHGILSSKLNPGLRCPERKPDAFLLHDCQHESAVVLP